MFACSRFQETVAGVVDRYTSVTSWRQSVKRGTSAGVFAACRVTRRLTRNDRASLERDLPTAGPTTTGQRHCHRVVSEG